MPQGDIFFMNHAQKSKSTKERAKRRKEILNIERFSSQEGEQKKQNVVFLINGFSLEVLVPV